MAIPNGNCAPATSPIRPNPMVMTDESSTQRRRLSRPDDYPDDENCRPSRRRPNASNEVRRRRRCPQGASTGSSRVEGEAERQPQAWSEISRMVGKRLRNSSGRLDEKRHGVIRSGSTSGASRSPGNRSKREQSSGSAGSAPPGCEDDERQRDIARASDGARFRERQPRPPGRPRLDCLVTLDHGTCIPRVCVRGTQATVRQPLGRTASKLRHRMASTRNSPRVDSRRHRCRLSPGHFCPDPVSMELGSVTELGTVHFGVRQRNPGGTQATASRSRSLFCAQVDLESPHFRQRRGRGKCRACALHPWAACCKQKSTGSATRGNTASAGFTCHNGFVTACIRDYHR